MTGIKRVSKKSIFSDLNHLEVVTTTTGKYETAFGFTEEVFIALDEFGMGKAVCADAYREGNSRGTYKEIWVYV